jgi:hypothetical protein
MPSAVAVSGLPQDQAMKVYGVKMSHPEYFEYWRWVWLEARPGLQVQQSMLAGNVWVDRARLMFADVDALGQWEHEKSLDGRADVVFRGKDAAVAAKKAGAPQITEGYGWVNLSIDDAVECYDKVEKIRTECSLLFASDFRPHSHHYFTGNLVALKVFFRKQASHARDRLIRQAELDHPNIIMKLSIIVTSGGRYRLSQRMTPPNHARSGLTCHAILWLQ